MIIDFIKPMNRFFYIPLVILLILFFVSACNESTKTLETDLISNPKSADESGKKQKKPLLLNSHV